MKYSIILTLFILTFVSCKDEMPIKGSFPKDVSLVDHNGKEFLFSHLKGKVLLVSYIFTNCPDICHIINHKMNDFKSRLREEGIENKVAYVSISIDPQNDTPEKLKMHIEHMKFNMKNWYFVTGSIGSVYKLISLAGIFPMREQTDNDLGYVINHRDRITLVDTNGNIRKHYKGTTMDFDIIIKDMKSLI